MPHIEVSFIAATARADALRQRADAARDASLALVTASRERRERMRADRADRAAARRFRRRAPWAACRPAGRVERRPSRRAAAGELPRVPPRLGPEVAGSWARMPVLASREARDGSGTTWIVRELDTTGLAGAPASRCLVFENHVVVRRIWQFPVDWERLDDARLLQLADVA